MCLVNVHMYCTYMCIRTYVYVHRYVRMYIRSICKEGVIISCYDCHTMKDNSLLGVCFEVCVCVCVRVCVCVCVYVSSVLE